MSYDLTVLSLGAGVQSTALLLMAEAGEIGPKPDCAIFADTQWEPAQIYNQLNWLEEVCAIPIHRVTAGDLRADILGAVGPAGVRIGRVANPPLYVLNSETQVNMPPASGGMLWRGCTTEYKIQPIQRKIRELLGYKPRQRVKRQARQLFGISIDEAHRMKDSRSPWIDNCYPLVESRLSRQDCLKWMKMQGYGSLQKSACIGCPYHSNRMWVNMAQKGGPEWENVVQFDRQLREGKLPGVTGDAYVHRSLVPLEEAVLMDYDPDQMDLFGEECEGMCGL